MKCYYHRDADAVGVCKSCQRGVCGDCATEVQDGIACLNRCERQASKIGRIHALSGNVTHLYAVFLDAMGLIFVAWWIIDGLRDYGWKPDTRVAFGCMFLVIGVALHLFALRLNQKQAANDDAAS